MKIERLLRIILLSGLLLILPNFSQAGHLPVKSYTTFDGLANDSVNKIFRDSRGFLWFCTGEGLSRFDGFGFKNYTQTEGLPHRNINDLLETADGDLLVATTNGLAVFNPNGTAYRWNILTSKLEQNTDAPPMFRTFLTPNPNDEAKRRSVLTLVQSPSGQVFAGTATALYQLEKSGGEWIFHEVASELFPADTVFAALQFDSYGYLWSLTSSGIYRMSPDGVVKKIEGDGGGSILLDKSGQIWISASGTNAGLRVFTISADGQTVELKRTYRKTDGLPIENAMSEIRQVSDGRVLVLAGETLCEFLPNAAENESKFRVIARGAFQSLAEDGGGSLWLGTVQEGAWKISPTGFVKFDQSDGIQPEDISSIFTNSGGELFITSGKQTVSHFTAGKFESIIPNGLKSRSWGSTYLDFQSANGDWWATSTQGLRFYSKPAKFTDLSTIPPKKVYTSADGLYSNEVSNLFEDSSGNVWITTINSGATLQRWERQTGKIIRFSADDNLPPSNGAIAFGEDSENNLWIGFYFGGLARYRHGKFQFFKAADGIPVGSIRSIYADKSGRLWIASASRGVFRSDDPTAENPKFVNISTAEGLASNQINCVTEDNFGRIYIGTGRGVNRLDPASGNLKLYTQADGLPGSVVSLCRRDSAGALWFVSRNSLVKFVPQTENLLRAPMVFIGSISVNGVTQKISELGAENAGNLSFSSDQKQIKIDFFALGFGAGDRLHYQYKLGEQDWSAPDEQKSVTFNLEPGDYRFAVRAVNADGVASENPATVSLTIAPPFYRRWWFILLSAIFVVGVILAVERTRAARLRALKNAFGKLSVSENRFRQMNEQSPLGIVIFAPDGSIRAVNRAYENFWGITYEQIKNWDFFNDEQLIRIGVVEKLRRVFAGETVHFPPEPYNPRDNNHGIEFVEKAAMPWFESFAYPVKNDAGELLEVILVMEDVTDAKRADEIERTAKSDRLRELEQVRRRIAADLHDDIGSSLTQISIFSEVLRQRVDKSNEKVLELLEFIASSSRELVDAMSDIVWAINPNKDFLSELSGKMRRFAADVFTARNIEFTYAATPIADIALGANLRREVYLIFKESVNNIVKHAECKTVEIELIIENSEIRLILRDDGKGFENNRENGGHGLFSMNARAVGLGGKLEIVSGKTSGTTVKLTVPLQSEQ
ncbi:MAG TPA: two-component regulator propeller domain-containing protein [Pyrinomonadaceae bacterium]|nr:two-component regulator propeller domain-containing protein [Pyrinomonadaceae bacterium]